MTTKAAILQVIRKKCLDCSGGLPGEVRECPITHCDLWPYRFGNDPSPGPARGCAKSPLPREGAREDHPLPYQGAIQVELSPKSSLGRTGFGKGEHLQPSGSLAKARQ